MSLTYVKLQDLHFFKTQLFDREIARCVSRIYRQILTRELRVRGRGVSPGQGRFSGMRGMNSRGVGVLRGEGHDVTRGKGFSLAREHDITREGVTTMWCSYCDDGVALGIAESREGLSSILNRKIDTIRKDLRSLLIEAWSYTKRRLDDTRWEERDNTR